MAESDQTKQEKLQPEQNLQGGIFGKKIQIYVCFKTHLHNNRIMI